MGFPENNIENMIRKHCFCAGVENKILIETISICPDCQSLFSTLVYQVPQDRIGLVLSRITQLMEELEIELQGGGGVRLKSNGEDETDGFTGE